MFILGRNRVIMSNVYKLLTWMLTRVKRGVNAVLKGLTRS